MKATELFNEQGKGLGIYFCSKCRRVNRTQQEAEECCVCRKCKTAEVTALVAYCDDCKEAEQKEREAMWLAKHNTAIEKAEETTEWEYIWFTDHMLGSIEELEDQCSFDDCPVPEFVFAMKPYMFKPLDFDRFIDGVDECIECEDIYLSEKAKGLDELRAAFDKFNEQNKDIQMYWVEDQSRKVRCREDKT